jgi:5'-3' exonuclease
MYALVNWWKLSHKDEQQDNLHLNDEFIQKFKKIFQNKLLEIPKKLNIPKTHKIKYIIGKDCSRENIWRLHLYPKYKENRQKNNKNLEPSTFFKIVQKENLFTETLDNIKIIYNENLECDDCLAISAKYIHKKYPNLNIYIIASDKDYMQLYNDKIHIYDLRYNSIVHSKSTLGSAKKDLLQKIINGDKSDNIPCIFGKINNKKTKQCIENIDYFYEILNKNSNIYEQYKLNRRLIDFNEIPNNFKNFIINEIKSFVN